MERQGFNNFHRGGGHPRNGYYHHSSRNHHHAPRHGRPNLHQQSHQSRHHHPQQQAPPQQAVQQQQQQQQALQAGPHYSQYHYYAPAAVIPSPQMAPASISSPQMAPTLGQPPMAPANVTSQFTLSPNAQEFIPSSFMTMRDPQQYMALQSGMLLVDPQPQMPLAMQRQSQQISHQAQAGGSHDAYEDPYTYYSKSYDEEDDAVLQLQMFITDVTLSPELFESKVQDISQVIIDDICIRKNPPSPVVATIFQAGVLQQNFRYSGARLCDVASGLVQIQGRPVFRDCLIEHTYNSLTKIKAVVGDKEQDKETRGTVLFCAELLFQLDLGYRLDINDTFPDMGILLSLIIKQLILCNEKENQKSGIQALKLCGANLEKLCEDTEAMNELLAECKALEEQEGVDSTIQFMLARLPQLRKTNWNHVKKSTPPPVVHFAPGPEDYNQMPVMYGPDGQPISEEELGFLNGIANQVPVGAGGGGGDYGEAPHVGSAGMDDEALEAYEQFLRETGQ